MAPRLLVRHAERVRELMQRTTNRLAPLAQIETL